MNSHFSPGGAISGIVFIVLGALFFLDATDVVELQLDLLLPIAVIALGLAVVLSAAWPRGREAS
ncbi:MAG: DUF5668 domain-containing protein [Chloroflexi bacterium]|nr:DUF5668 domain-containing protein [Chloroflexota bacterium]MDA1002870.1 DUF5668 domain-containing protein [Chloroflexota bacterium]